MDQTWTARSSTKAEFMKRNLIIGTLLALTLSSSLSAQVPLTVLTDLQGHPLASPRPVEALGALRVGGGKAPTPNQSYLAKQMQTRLAACMASVVQAVSNYARVSPTAWQVPDNVLWKPVGWRVKNQHFDYRPVPGQDHNDGPYASVTFSHARWDPDLLQNQLRDEDDRAGCQSLGLRKI